MFKRLADSYGVLTREGVDMVLGIDPSSTVSGEVESVAMTILSKKQRYSVLKGEQNAIDLLRDTNPGAFNNDVMLRMYDKLDEYNLLYKLYDDPAVYDWSWDDVQRLTKSPPDPVVTIMSPFWMNPWAVTHLLKLPMSPDQWLNGFSPRSLQAVRDYFTSEDPWTLHTGCPQEVGTIFSVLFKKGWVTKKGDHWVPNKKYRKTAPRFIRWQKHTEKFGIIRDLTPTFSQLTVEQSLAQPPTTFPKLTELDDMPAADKNTLFVGITKWDLRDCPGPNMCVWDEVDKAIFGANIYTRVIFLLRSQMKCQLDLPHIVYPTTRLGAAAGFVQRCIEKRLKRDVCPKFVILIIP